MMLTAVCGAVWVCVCVFHEKQQTLNKVDKFDAKNLI